MAAGIFFPAPITIETDLQGVIRNEAMSRTPMGAASTTEIRSVGAATSSQSFGPG
jgi:hypothetical protein